MIYKDTANQPSAKSSAGHPQGALGLVGAWREVSDSDIDSFIKDIYKARENDSTRPVQLEL